MFSVFDTVRKKILNHRNKQNVKNNTAKSRGIEGEAVRDTNLCAPNITYCDE